MSHKFVSEVAFPELASGSTQTLQITDTGIVTASSTGAVPTGTALPSFLPAAPSGYLLCNGAEVSRTTYSSLFAAIGVTFGAGDGVNTFKLPDTRGRFLRGISAGSGIDPDAGSRSDRGDGTTGDAVGTLQADQLKSHNHQVWRSVGEGDSNNVPSYSAVGVTGESAGGNSFSGNLISSSGGNETRPTNIYVNYIIKT